jgi:hypothetical protein
MQKSCKPHVHAIILVMALLMIPAAAEDRMAITQAAEQYPDAVAGLVRKAEAPLHFSSFSRA